MSTSIRQKLLRLLYPMIRKSGASGAKGTILHNTQQKAPASSLFAIPFTLNNGQSATLSAYAGKKIILVNTASDCGYTGQYAELQTLHEQMGDKLVMIAFPANDFKEQEKGNDHDIAEFCKINYGVTFPLAQKGVVTKSNEQQPIFKWLTDAQQNGWNNHQPDWNFSKYLIDEHGRLMFYFGPAISPLHPEFKKAVESL